MREREKKKKCYWYKICWTSIIAFWWFLENGWHTFSLYFCFEVTKYEFSGKPRTSYKHFFPQLLLQKSVFWTFQALFWRIFIVCQIPSETLLIFKNHNFCLPAVTCFIRTKKEGKKEPDVWKLRLLCNMVKEKYIYWKRGKLRTS